MYICNPNTPTSYADYKADKWKPYEELVPGKEPDSIRVKKGLIQDYHHKKWSLRSSSGGQYEN